jgi:RND family efflux transporter MFP subunit
MNAGYLILAVSLLLASCGKAETPAATVDRPAMTFVVGALRNVSARTYSGEVRARYESALGFRIGGKIVQRLVDIGTVVKKGQVIARLDPEDVKLQQEAALAQRVLAEDELKRYRDLRAQGFVSQSALDAKETSFKAASAQAGLAGNQADYATLTADSNGVVTAVMAEVGQVVGAGQAVVRLAHQGGREVAIAVPELQLSSVKPGKAAVIELPSSIGDAIRYPAHVRELSPAADPASRTYAARVSFDKADSRVALGMTATVRIASGMRGETFQVPLGAIFQQGDQSAVWIVNQDRTVALRAVSVSAYTDDGAFIASGISEGDRIVSSGVHKIVAGEKIRIIESGAKL